MPVTLYRRTQQGYNAWLHQQLPAPERTLLANLRLAMSVEELEELWTPAEDRPMDAVLALLLNRGWVQQEVRDDPEEAPPAAQSSPIELPTPAPRQHVDIDPPEPVIVPKHHDPDALLIAMGILRQDNPADPVPPRSSPPRGGGTPPPAPPSSPSPAPSNPSGPSSGSGGSSSGRASAPPPSSRNSLFRQSLGAASAEEAGRAAARARAEERDAKRKQELAALEEKRAVERSYQEVHQSRTVAGVSERLRRLQEDKK